MGKAKSKFQTTTKNEVFPFSAQVVHAGPREAEGTKVDATVPQQLTKTLLLVVGSSSSVLTWGTRALALQSWRANSHAGLSLSPPAPGSMA